jgi:hypothetical protein
MEKHMKGRTITIIFLSLVLLGVLGLCGLTTFGTYRWAKASGLGSINVSNDVVSAQVSETHTFPAEPGLTLDVNTAAGNIIVNAVPGVKEITLEVTKTGWGTTETEARAAAEKLSVEQHQEGNKVVAAFEPDEPNRLTFGTYRLPRASFTIQVPPETIVTLRTRNGDLSLSGTQAKAILDCDFGTLTIRDVAGAQEINGNNSNLDISGIQARKDAISLSTSFGEIKAVNLVAGTVTVANTNGAILLTGVKTSGILTVETSFGAINLNDVSSSRLELSNQNGAIAITRAVIAGTLRAETSFDSLDLAQVQADGYTLVNQNGAVNLDGAQGVLDITTSFADIKVNHADDAVLKMTNQNGMISFSGTLKADADQSIETSFADIVIAIPTTTAANVEVSTSFGTIQSDLPLTMSGQISEDNWSGKLNGGGKLLKIQNQNGSVKITELK